MNPLVSRRHFLAAAVAIPAGLASAASLAPLPTFPTTQPGGTRLKPSLNAYSFLELLNANAKDSTQGVDLFRVCDFCAQQGFDGVDLTGYFFPGYPGAPTDSYIFRLKRHAFNLGLGISGTGVRNDFTTTNRAVRAEGVQRIKTWIEVAAKLGAPTVRAFADSQPPFKNWQEAAGNAPREAVEEWVADSLRECALHAEKFGVIMAVQNHGDFISSGTEHLSLLNRVNHESCAAMVDTGKYLSADPYADITLMAPHAVNWQIKENTQSTLESPRTDLKKIMTIVRQSGYHGYLPIETLRMGRAGYDSFQAVSRMLGELREAIEATR